MINKKEEKKIISAINSDDFGMSITDLVNKTNIKRSRIRIVIAYLMGAKKIKERFSGMSKIYILQ